MKDDAKSLKHIGIRLTRSLSILTKEDWKMADIPLGIKLCIEAHNKDDTICYEFDELEVNEGSATLDRIVVTTDKGDLYEVDRYCPHKGADLSKV